MPFRRNRRRLHPPGRPSSSGSREREGRKEEEERSASSSRSSFELLPRKIVFVLQSAHMSKCVCESSTTSQNLDSDRRNKRKEAHLLLDVLHLDLLLLPRRWQVDPLSMRSYPRHVHYRPFGMICTPVLFRFPILELVGSPSSWR